MMYPISQELLLSLNRKDVLFGEWLGRLGAMRSDDRRSAVLRTQPASLFSPVGPLSLSQGKNNAR